MDKRRSLRWALNTALRARRWMSRCPLTCPGDLFFLREAFHNHNQLTGFCWEPVRGQHVIVEVTYETSPSATALQWLTPEQTAGKQQPYLFSQCQVCRALPLTQVTPFCFLISCFCNIWVSSAKLCSPKCLSSLLSSCFILSFFSNRQEV